MMKIAVTGHQIDTGEAVRSHVAKRLELADPMEPHVAFSREGNPLHAHLSVQGGKVLLAEGRADDGAIHASFNVAAEHVEKQLRRHKRKLREHH